MTHDSTTIFRYTYTSRRNGKRFTARVRIHSRIENEGVILLLLAPVGRWPDREDLTKLADLAESKGVPMVSGIILTPEEEAEWREENLRPEANAWKGAA